MVKGQGQTAGTNVCSISFDSFTWSKISYFYSPLWNKGHIALHLSVCWSYVDQAMSAQYFLTTRLESCQTWYSGCHERVDVPYWFPCHIFKDEGQTAGLHRACCLLNILWPLMVTKLAAHFLTTEIALWVTRLRSNYWFSFQHCPFNML